MPGTKNVVGVLGALSLAGFMLSTASSPASADCSGLMCMFAPKPAETPPPAQPAQPAQPAPAAPVETAAPDTTPVLRKKPRSRPVPVVTIAAGPTEIARLKALSAVVARPHVRIVEANGRGKAADFAVTTTLDPERGVEKAKLFAEELHILAGPGIHTLSDLRGRVVSFGAADSAGQAVARKAFEAAGIQVAETPLEFDNALDGLATGDVDAVVVLAPQPDQQLQKLEAPGLHLVAWPESARVPDGASAATIDASAYPGLSRPGDKVAALAVDAVLTLEPRGRDEPAAKAFLGALAQHSAALSRRGFDRLRADLVDRAGRHVANAETR